MISSDFEHGAGCIMPETATDFPWAVAVAVADDTKLTYVMGVAGDREGRTQGAHWNFAPTIDLTPNRNSPVVNTRAMSDRTELVIRHLKPWIDGIQARSRMAACAKVFPGDGVDGALVDAGEADTRPGRRSYRIALEKRAVEEIGGEAIEEGMLKALRRGWCFSSEEFQEALVEKMGKKDGSVHTNNGSAIKRTHDEQEAERFIAIGLKALGISAVDLPKQPKGSAEKIALASVARQRTSVTNA